MHEFIIPVGFEEEAGLSCYCIVVEDMLLEVEGKQAEEGILVVESRLVEEVGIGHLLVPGNPTTKKINCTNAIHVKIVKVLINSAWVNVAS